MAKNVENVENTEYQEPITKEEMQDEIAINESAILRALTDQSQHDDRVETIDMEWDKCRERNTIYQKIRRLGGRRLPESTNTTGYHSDLIYTATVDEDKAKLWDNQKFWSAVNAVTGTDMVDKLIPYAGKKQQVVERIEMLSGYGDESEADYEEAVKN